MNFNECRKLLNEEAAIVGRLASSLDYLTVQIEGSYSGQLAAERSRRLLTEIGFVNGRFRVPPQPKGE